MVGAGRVGRLAGALAAPALVVWICAGAAFGAAPREIDLATTTGLLRIDGVDVSDEFGSHAASCDVNGDGIEDLLIAAREGYGPGNTRTLAGEAYLIYGRKGSWSGSLQVADVSSVILYGSDDLDDFGNGVARHLGQVDAHLPADRFRLGDGGRLGRFPAQGLGWLGQGRQLDRQAHEAGHFAGQEKGEQE